MLKTCFFSWDEPSFVSGCRAWVERLLPELPKHGISPTVLYLRAQSGNREEHVKALEASGIPCIPFPTISEWTTPAIIQAVLKTFKGSPPDIFVPNFWLPGYYAAADLRQAGIQTVGVLHSDDDYYWGIVDATVTSSNYQHRITHWAAVSQHLEHELMRRNVTQGPLTVSTIPAGVRRATSTAVPAGNGPFRIGFFGRIVTEQKRILDVARAMVLIAKRFENVSCEIYGFGPQEVELRAYLASHAKDLPVKYLGGLSSDESLKTIAKMHTVLLLSDYEGLSVTLMESMAAGVPPISYNCASGTRELIQPNVNGFIVNNRDTEVVDAVGQMIGDAATWQRLSDAAIKTHSGPFSVEGGALLWAQLLKKACRNPAIRLRRLYKQLGFTEWLYPYSRTASALPEVHVLHGPKLDQR